MWRFETTDITKGLRNLVELDAPTRRCSASRSSTIAQLSKLGGKHNIIISHYSISLFTKYIILYWNLLVVYYFFVVKVYVESYVFILAHIFRSSGWNVDVWWFNPTFTFHNKFNFNYPIQITYQKEILRRSR